MGSFTEVVLSLNFRPDTPPEVMAAFSALSRPADGPLFRPAPVLPDPVVEVDEDWVPDWRDRDLIEPGSLDAADDEPWLHEWAPWLSNSMSVGTVPHAALVWDGYRWNLAFRTSFKASPESITEFLDWLAPFVEYADQQPILLGYLYEYFQRPHLIWCEDGHLRREDLNLPAEHDPESA